MDVMLGKKTLLGSAKAYSKSPYCEHLKAYLENSHGHVAEGAGEFGSETSEDCGRSGVCYGRQGAGLRSEEDL